MASIGPHHLPGSASLVIDVMRDAPTEVGLPHHPALPVPLETGSSTAAIDDLGQPVLVVVAQPGCRTVWSLDLHRPTCLVVGPSPDCASFVAIADQIIHYIPHIGPNRTVRSVQRYHAASGIALESVGGAVRQFHI